MDKLYQFVVLLVTLHSGKSPTVVYIETIVNALHDVALRVLKRQRQHIHRLPRRYSTFILHSSTSMNFSVFSDITVSDW